MWQEGLLLEQLRNRIVIPVLGWTAGGAGGKMPRCRHIKPYWSRPPVETSQQWDKWVWRSEARAWLLGHFITAGGGSGRSIRGVRNVGEISKFQFTSYTGFAPC